MGRAGNGAPPRAPQRTGRCRRAGHRSLVLLLLALLASGCSARGADVATDDDLMVVTSMSVLADLAGEVVGDRGTVVSLVPIGGDPHVHEPTPSDAQRLQTADLVLSNGAGLEPWLDGLVPAGSDRVDLSQILAARIVLDEDGQPDPHVWMVPTMASVYVQEIAAAVSDLDPSGAHVYQANAERYIAELEDLDVTLRERLSAIPAERRLLVTSHDAYRYFADHYGFEVVGSVLGVSTEEEPSAGRVRRLIDEIERREVPTIFVETTVDPRVLEQVSRETGLQIGQPLHGDSLGPAGSGADTYAGMMRANVDALVEGLAP